MKKLAAILLGLMLLISVPASVSADSRCSGKLGVTLYEHAGYGGAQITFCTVTVLGVGTVFAPVSYLGNYTTGLSAGATWNDRPSAFQFFNTGGKKIRFFDDSGYTGQYITATGNTNEKNIHDGLNFGDKMSSFKLVS